MNATLVEFPSGKVLSKAKLPPGQVFRAADPAFVLVRPMGWRFADSDPIARSSAVEFRTGQVIMSDADGLDVFGTTSSSNFRTASWDSASEARECSPLSPSKCRSSAAVACLSTAGTRCSVDSISDTDPPARPFRLASLLFVEEHQVDPGCLERRVQIDGVQQLFFGARIVTAVL